MKFILTAALMAVPLSVHADSFEQLLGDNYAELMRSAATAPAEPASKPGNVSAPGSPAVPSPLPAGTVEKEMKKCPANAETITSKPDPDLFTYMGFVHVRSDNSTCRPEPSGAIYYQEPASSELSFAPQEAPPFTYDYALKTPEYVIQRDFYFRTQLDGTRSFYSRDSRRYTEKMIPETVQLDFVNRSAYPLLPWEQQEVFQLKYGLRDGAALTPGGRTSYEYDIRPAAGTNEDGTLSTKIEVFAVKKKALTPPEQGVVSLTVAKRGDALILDIGDTRAKYYAGEKLGLRIVLKRSVFLLQDKVMYDIGVDLPSAPQLVIDLSDPKWAPFKKEDVFPGKEYYAEWSFRRTDSAISSGEWIEKGKSNKLKL